MPAAIIDHLCIPQTTVDKNGKNNSKNRKLDMRVSIIIVHTGWRVLTDFNINSYKRILCFEVTEEKNLGKSTGFNSDESSALSLLQIKSVGARIDCGDPRKGA